MPEPSIEQKLKDNLSFPKRAGNMHDTDEVLAAELEAAGIKVERHEFWRKQTEANSAVVGTLHGWLFKRAWAYWIAEGPGIALEDAELLHEAYGRVVRVAGHCGCPSPGEWFKGFACGHYHIDTQAGLNALAATLRGIAQRYEERSKTCAQD